MRLPRLAASLMLALVGACSADRTMPTASPPGAHISATIRLDQTGPRPLQESRALALNDSGIVVGDAAPNGGPMRAIVWSPPNYTFAFLPDLVGEDDSGPFVAQSTAYAIADDGTIAGQACEVTGTCHPVFWRGGTLHVLDGIGQVNAICPCDSHTMVGEVAVDGAVHGALWVDEVLIDIGAPAGFTNARLVAVAHGFIVGDAFNDSLTAPGIVPFRWTPTNGWTQLTGRGPVTDVNSSGTAVGVPNELWLNGSNTPTTVPDGIETDAINDSGAVAGLIPGPAEGLQVPAVWTKSTGWNMIGSDFFVIVTAINNSRRVTGIIAHDGAHAVLF